MPEMMGFHERPVEREIDRLVRVIEHVLGLRPGDPGLPGDPGEPPTSGVRFAQLEMILGAEPQRDIRGSLRYLVTSGIAVEMLTGFQRDHHDLDFVIIDSDNEGRFWEIYGTDNVTPVSIGPI